MHMTFVAPKRKRLGHDVAVCTDPPGLLHKHAFVASPSGSEPVHAPIGSGKDEAMPPNESLNPLVSPIGAARWPFEAYGSSFGYCVLGYFDP